MFKECPICGGTLKDVPLFLELQSSDRYLAKLDDFYIKELLHKSTDTQLSSIKMVCPDCITDITKYMSDEAIKELEQKVVQFVIGKGDV